MTRRLITAVFGVPMLVAAMGLTARADLALSIESLTVTPTGGSFFVRATPDPPANTTVHSFDVTLLFNNFVGGLASLDVTLTGQVAGLFNFEPDSSGPPWPVAAGDGDTVKIAGFGAGTIDSGGSNVVRADFTVAGGFIPPQSFDVQISSTNFAHAVDGAIPTTISGGPTTVTAVPEPSSFILLGVVAVLAGGGHWLRRRFFC